MKVAAPFRSMRPGLPRSALGGLVAGILLACNLAHGETVRVGGLTAEVLGELLYDKSRHLMVWPETMNAGERAQINNDMIFIFREQVIACGGFLDQLEKSFPSDTDLSASLRKIEVNDHMDGYYKRASILSTLRYNMPSLDKRAVEFASAHFLEVMATLGKGNWTFAPACTTKAFAMEFSK